MGFGAQRIANTYALWSKVRRRQDSNGQKVYSPFGESIDKEIVNLKLLTSFLKLNSENLGIPHLYEYRLESEEEIEYIESDKISHYSFPKIAEINDFGMKELNRFSNWEDFIHSLPEKYVEVDSKLRSSNLDLLWSSSTGQIKKIVRPEHLGIVVNNSTNYKVNMSSNNNNEPFSRHSCVMVKGLNEDFLEIKEYVKVFRDGYFETKNAFREITEIDYDGFDGDVNIFLGRKTNGTYFRRRYPYVIGATPYNEGAIDIEVVRDSDGSAFLNTYLITEKYGFERTNNKSIDYDSYELVAEQLLLDESGVQISVVDYFISPIDSKIYVLSTNSKIHIFEFKISEFKESVWSNSPYNILLLNANRQRVGLGDTDYLYTNFINDKFRIKNVKIKVTDPNGNTSYLQADRKFSQNEFLFVGRNQPLGSLTWDDIRFKYTFDTTGQYDFNLEVSVRGSTEVFSSTISIMCEKNTALKSYQLSYTELNSIYLSKKNEICVENDTNKYYLRGEHEGFFGDFINQRLIFRKEYEYIKVIGNE